MAEKPDRTLASPNTPVNAYFGAVRHLVRIAGETEWEADRKALVALSILMAVATVETFFNIWFRTVAQHEPYKAHRDQIVADLKKRNQRGLRYKLKEWPKLFFKKSLDFSQGVGKEFLMLVDKRNALMHVTTTCETAEFPGFRTQDMVDVTDYENLAISDAESAMHLCEDFMRSFFQLKGDNPEDVLAQLHLWIGRVPFPEEIERARAQKPQDGTA